MKLIDNLYKITARLSTDDAVVYQIELLADSPIYKAHFPGNPITPGVCQIQMALELLEIIENQKLNIKTLKNVKFISALIPQGQHISVVFNNITRQENEIKTQATIKDTNDVIYAKISLQTVIA